MIFESLPPAGIFKISGVTEMERTEKSITLEVTENLAEVLAIAARNQIMDIETHNLSLEDIFLAYYSKEGSKNA